MAIREVGSGKTFATLKAATDAASSGDEIHIFDDITETAANPVSGKSFIIRKAPGVIQRPTINLDFNRLTFQTIPTGIFEIRDLKFINLAEDLEIRFLGSNSDLIIERNVFIWVSTRKFSIRLNSGVSNNTVLCRNNYIEAVGSVLGVVQSTEDWASVKVINNTIVRTGAASSGAIVTFTGIASGQTKFKNNIVIAKMTSGNAAISGTNAPIADFNNITQADTKYSGFTSPGASDVSGDPQLFNTFEINSLSPAFNTGQTNAIDSDVPTDDINGNPRSTDIGCFEFFNVGIFNDALTSIHRSIIKPRFNVDQGNITKYQIKVGTTSGGNDIWDSGLVVANPSEPVLFDGSIISRGVIVFATIEINDANGNLATFSTFPFKILSNRPITGYIQQF